MKPAITDTYDFKYLIESGANYVDKTEYLHKLVSSISNTYFLSRPRRFGKSLTVSTLECIFQGRRDLFAGLKIDSMDYDWQEYPVVNLNMSELKHDSKESFSRSLLKSLKQVALELDVVIDTDDEFGDIFRDILHNAASQSPTGKVVLLIDEYDAPLVNNIDAPHLEEIRAILENFYIQIKAANSVLRFTFMTGVTRFSKVSVFSKLNHMIDISMNQHYATMFGFTQAELESYFGDRIAEFAIRENLSTEDMTLKIKSWYNGYRFHPKADTVYNPVSAGRFMEDGEFNNWWFETGSPSFLIQQLRKKPIGYFDMLERAIPADFVGSFDPAKIDARSLLFQTGYLTIVDADNEDDMGWWFILGFPNKEVELSLSTHLVAELGTGDSSESLYAARILSRAIRRGDTQAVIDAIHSHLAAIPYDSPVLNEGNFKSLLFLLLRMAGVAIAAEHYTNKGRLDMVVHSPDHIYLFELKHNSSSQEAMDQIHRKRYYEQFVGSGKQLHLIALNYSPEERNIATDWIEETL